jgi:hypothetical protein
MRGKKPPGRMIVFAVILLWFVVLLICMRRTAQDGGLCDFHVSFFLWKQSNSHSRGV